MSERPETRTEGGAISAEALLAHSRWLSNLARALVREPGDAEDLVQQTYAHALAAPPEHAQNLRGWLARIARNLASSGARDRRRREQRELAAPRPEPPATPEEAVARAELRRRVVDAVLALAEPYRATLVMRFFDEMSADEIARATTTPIETVRTRVKRALEQLRARLERERDREGRSLASALLAFAGTGGNEAIGISIGSALMLTMAFVVISGLTWFVWPNAPTPARPDAGPPNAVEPAAVANAPAATVPSRVERTDAAPPAPVPPVAAASQPSATYRVSGVVRDAAGAPVAGARVFLYESRAQGPSEDSELLSLASRDERKRPLPDGTAVLSTAADGSFEFPDASVSRALRIGAWHAEHGAGIVVLPPDPQPDSRVDGGLELYRLMTVRGRVVDGEGRAAPGAQVTFSIQEGRDSYLRTGAASEIDPQVSSSSVFRANDLGEFSLRPRPPGHFELSAMVDGTAPSTTIAFDLSLASPEKFVELVLGTASARRITGRILAPDGSAARLAETVLAPLIAGGGKAEQLIFMGWQDDPGEPGATDPLKHDAPIEWFVEDLADDAYDVAITIPEIRFIGVVARDLLLGKSEITDPDHGPDVVIDIARLPPFAQKLAVHVRIAVPAGAPDAPPLQGELEWGIGGPVSDDETTGSAFSGSSGLELSRGTETEHDVAFRSPCLCVVRVVAPGFATVWSRPLLVAPDGEQEVVLALRPAVARLVGTATLADGTPVPDVPLTLYEQMDGVWRQTAIAGQRTTATGRFEIGDLAAGDYVLLAHVSGRAAARAFVHLDEEAAEPVALVAEAGVDCTIDLLKNGLLATRQLLRVLDEEGVPLLDDWEGTAPSWRARSQYKLRLAPGHYTAELTVPSGAVATTEFDVGSATTTVTLALPPP